MSAVVIMQEDVMKDVLADKCEQLCCVVIMLISNTAISPVTLRYYVPPAGGKRRLSRDET